MYWLFLPVGILIITAVVVDALWTTMWVDGSSGFLSARLTTALWWVWRRVVPADDHKWLSLNGPLTLASTLVMWVVLLWSGWVFVFTSAPHALQNIRSHEQAAIWGRIYYVGYAMFTMGNGDLTPNAQPVWQMATAVCTASGMVVVTLAVSYVISVIGAVVRKRALAAQISAYGQQAEALVNHFWNGERFEGVEIELSALSAALAEITEQHMAYPILHYYHAVQPEKSSAMTVALVLDALLLFRHGVAEEHRPAQPTVAALLTSIGTYLDTLQGAWFSAADQAPEPPDLGWLRQAGIPVVDQGDFDREIGRYHQRRKLALGLVSKSAWHWPPIEQTIGLSGPDEPAGGSAPEGAEPAE